MTVFNTMYYKDTYKIYATCNGVVCSGWGRRCPHGSVKVVRYNRWASKDYCGVIIRTRIYM